MKKQFIYGLLSLTVLSGAGLSSCSSEEDFAGPKGQKVMLSITASKDAQTRTSFEETEDGLLCKWTEGDKLLVTNTSGQRLGVITLQGEGGVTTGLFKGPVTLDGNQTVNLFYLGNGKAIPETLTENAYTLDLSAQDGTFASLAVNDFMHQEADVKLLDGEATGSVMMDRRVAEGHFDLQLPGGLQLKAGDVVTITQPDGAFCVAPKIKYGNGGSLVNTTDNGTLTITKAEDGNDLYVTIFPQTLTPTFTVTTKAGSVYTATLGIHVWEQSTYVDNEDGSGVAVELKEEKAPVTDGMILGVKWAAVNTRSYIDCATYDDNAYYFSYIPGISLADQGLEVKHVSDNMVTPTNNPNAYHYQWGRNFGFPASTGGLLSTRVPNYLNIPTSWPDKYTYYSIGYGPGTAIESIQNPDTYIVRTDGGYDWCSSTLSEWPTYDDNGELLSAAPKGFRLPTKADFLTLLPTGDSGNTYTATKSFVVDGETIRPVYATSTEDGTTVVWAILNSSSMNYLALFELAGKFKLEDINESLFGDNGKVVDYIDFPAQGSRVANSSNPNMQDWKARGWYWASTSSTTAGYADMFRFDISGNSITLYVASLPKRNALSVRCIYDN